MKIIKTIALVVLLGFAGQSFAVPITCSSAGITSNVSSTSGCEIGSTNNDFLNPLQVNLDLMFGFDDWLFGQKVMETATNIDLGFAISDDTISGSWSINNIWSSYENAMIVIKGGTGSNTVTTYVGYLLDDGALGGTFISPFANPSNGNLKDISHMSIYVRGNSSTVVPEPATIALFGIGALFLGFRNRKRS